MATRPKNLEIEDAKLLGGSFKNFSGVKTDKNPSGKRTFAVIIPGDSVDALIAEGWNIKQLKASEEGDEPVYFLNIEVKFDNFPPDVWCISGRKKTKLDEDTINELDNSEILTTDVVISPYCWEVNGKHGVKAYLDTMYVTVKENRFASKYDNLD